MPKRNIIHVHINALHYVEFFNLFSRGPRKSNGIILRKFFMFIAKKSEVYFIVDIIF